MLVRQNEHQHQSVMMPAASASRFAELVFVAAMKRLRARFATDSEQTATEGTDHPGSEGRWNAAALMGAWLASKDRIGKRIRLEESTSAAEGAARSARSTAKNRWLDLGLVALEAALRSPHGSRPALKWI